MENVLYLSKGQAVIVAVLSNLECRNLLCPGGLSGGSHVGGAGNPVSSSLC